ncbi:MAG: hypothetical protein JWQ87_5288 [Candidatus Sulfotelmatobacter sp.]|nr:hypothetical protein [Candidatus Sulfotelmatobacter sp.]
MKRPPITTDDIENLIRNGVDTLLRQHEYSMGYLLGNDDNIVETNIVLHLGAEFIAKGHAVWAESPFKNDLSEKSVNHLDLLVDLHPEPSESATLLLAEAKRILKGNGTAKVIEIINDYQRLVAWSDLGLGERPMFFDLNMPVERVFGALVVLLAEESATAPADGRGSSFADWWEHLGNQPTGYDTARLNELGHIVKHMKRGVKRSRFTADGLRLAVAYALFEKQCSIEDSDLVIAKHEAAHVVVAWRLGLPVRFVSIEEDETNRETALDGRTLCDWTSLFGTTSNRTLCTNAFAVAYAGAWLDAQIRGCSFNEAYENLPTDSRSAEVIRSKLMEWEKVDSTATAAESKAGCDLAQRVVEAQMSRIERLANTLSSERLMDEETLKGWFTGDVAAHGV